MFVFRTTHQSNYYEQLNRQVELDESFASNSMQLVTQRSIIVWERHEYGWKQLAINKRLLLLTDEYFNSHKLLTVVISISQLCFQNDIIFFVLYDIIYLWNKFFYRSHLKENPSSLQYTIFHVHFIDALDLQWCFFFYSFHWCFRM